MILRERMHLSATPDQIWAVLADPALMELWNPKCVRCQAEGNLVRVGLSYRAIFRLSGPEQETRCEVLECRPGRTLTIRFTMETPRAGHVDETFHLQSAGDGTEVTHDVDFTHSGLPWWLKVFMKVLGVFGHRRGKSSLDGIAEMVPQATQQAWVRKRTWQKSASSDA